MATEAERSQKEDIMGASWTALAANENPRERGIKTVLVEVGAKVRGGRGGGGGRWDRDGKLGQRKQTENSTTI